MRRAVRGATVGGLLLLLAVGCGSGGTQVGAGPVSSPAPLTGATKVVSFGAATLDVPSGWPVYDLTVSPHRCARFDQHAVYLGHQAADAACPARLLGKTEAVQVEADDAVARARVLPSAATAQVNGLAVAYEPGSGASHEIVATVPALGVVVTATYGNDLATAQQVVASVRKSGA